jgi:hypothetical protein
MIFLIFGVNFLAEKVYLTTFTFLVMGILPILWKNMIVSTYTVNRGGKHSTTPFKHTSTTAHNKAGREVVKELVKNPLYFHLCITYCVISFGKLGMRMNSLLT